jgi:8-oxo-dGTP pyrophosphatase MutT (NUDIX family)
MTPGTDLFPRLWRHVEACNNLASPAHLVPFRIGEERVGWLGPELARALAFFPRDVHFDGKGAALAGRLRGEGARTAALERLAAALAGRGHFRLRGEAFDVRATPEGPVLARLDRGALPPFGIISQGVHVNGVVRRPEGPQLWVGWRSRHKPVAPGQLDNVVAGGIPAGLGIEETLVKEAEEEASLPAALAARAIRVGRVSYVMANEEGLRRDVLHVFDLDLPEDVVPRPQDDEVERFELRPAADILREVAEGDRVKFNVNLVLIDFALRHGLLAGLTEAQRARLRAGLDQVG